MTCKNCGSANEELRDSVTSYVEYDNKQPVTKLVDIRKHFYETEGLRIDTDKYYKCTNCGKVREAE